MLEQFILLFYFTIHPYPCKDEIELLREFFGLGRKEVRLITASLNFN